MLKDDNKPGPEEDTWRVCTFTADGQLVGAFLHTLPACFELQSLDISEGAGTVYLVLGHDAESVVVVGTAEGSVLARHPAVPAPVMACSEPDHTRLLLIPDTGETLYICCGSSMQVISLSSAHADEYIDGFCSSWGELAVILTSNGFCERLHFVDLALQRRWHCEHLRYEPGCFGGIAAGSGAVSVSKGTRVRVFSALRANAGALLWTARHTQGFWMAWDGLGRYLAVGSPECSLSIYDGKRGAVRAVWHAPPVPGIVMSLRWLPGSAGLVWEGEREALVDGLEETLASWCVLRFV